MVELEISKVLTVGRWGIALILAALFTENAKGFPFELGPAQYPYLAASYDNSTQMLFSMINPPDDAVISVLIDDSSEKEFNGIFLLDLKNQNDSQIDFEFKTKKDQRVSMKALDGRIEFSFKARVQNYVDQESTIQAAYQVVNASDYLILPTLSGSNVDNMTLVESESFTIITPNAILTRSIYTVDPPETVICFKKLTYSVEYNKDNVISGEREYWYSTSDLMDITADFSDSAPCSISRQKRNHVRRDS